MLTSFYQRQFKYYVLKSTVPIAGLLIVLSMFTFVSCEASGSGDDTSNAATENTSEADDSGGNTDSPYVYYKLGGGGEPNKLYAKRMADDDALLISDDAALDIGDQIMADAVNDYVYFMQEDATNKWNLYRCDMKNGAERKKLNGGGNLDTGDGNLHRDADSDRIFYIADQDVDDQFELYMIDMEDPDTSTKVNASLTAGTDVESFQVSPDGESALYRVGDELHLVDLDSPGVSDELDNPGTLIRYDFSLDSSRVVFNAFVFVRFTIELYIVDVTARATSTMLTPTQNGQGVFTYQFLPGGDEVIYTAMQNASNVMEMFIVNLATPGVSTKVHPDMVTGGEIYYDTATFTNESISDPVVVSPDGTKVIYAADLETDEQVELWVTDLSDLGTATKLNATLPADGDVSVAYQFMDDSNGVVVHQAGQDSGAANELYHVWTADPGITTKLNPELVAGGNVGTTSLFIDGDNVYYGAEQETAGVERLYRVDINDPGNATQVDDTEASDLRTLQRFVIAQ